jgi:hypothetical protein
LPWKPLREEHHAEGVMKIVAPEDIILIAMEIGTPRQEGFCISALK